MAADCSPPPLCSYVPSNYDNSTAYPFSFYFRQPPSPHNHSIYCTLPALTSLSSPISDGYSSDYTQGIGFNMTGDAEKNGFILAFPRGTVSPTTNLRGWSAGVCCLFLNSSSTYVDDVEFTREALGLIEQAVHIDPRRRHTMGWSNGGYMSERLACEVPRLWAAVAADASAVGIGIGGETGLDFCDRAYGRGGRGTLSLLLFHGTADAVVPWTGFDSKGWLANTPSTLEDSARWVTRMGCGPMVTTSFNDGQFSNIVWPECDQGTEFELMSVRGGVHAWWTPAQDSTSLLLNIPWTFSHAPQRGSWRCWRARQRSRGFRVG